MFEKEAEEYAKNNAYKQTYNYLTCKVAYQKGAVFGYEDMLTDEKSGQGVSLTAAEIRRRK